MQHQTEAVGNANPKERILTQDSFIKTNDMDMFMLRRKREKEAESVPDESSQEKKETGTRVETSEERAVAEAPKEEAEDKSETKAEESAGKEEDAGASPQEKPDEAKDDAQIESVIMTGFKRWLAEVEQDEERRSRAESAMKQIERAFLTGSSEEEVFRLVAKGADYDHAVACAEKSGEIRGRNASIEELMAEEKASDGVPHPGTGSVGFTDGRSPSIFELARGAM